MKKTAKPASTVQLRPITAFTAIALQRTGSTLFHGVEPGKDAPATNVNDPDTLFSLLAYLYIQSAPEEDVYRIVYGPRAEFEQAVAKFSQGISLDTLTTLGEIAVAGVAAMKAVPKE